MRRTKSQFFMPAGSKPRNGQGGARNNVEANALKAGSNIQRVYNAPAILNYDMSDPRYEGKSDLVENIYLPAVEVATQPRSGFAQILNWLVKGRME